jgi:autotransporter-associated beta strand protein
MNRSVLKRVLFCCAVTLPVIETSLGGSATWAEQAVNNDWNTEANWIPNTIPNGPTDVATFATSNITDITTAPGIVEISSIVFDAAAMPFRITVGVGSVVKISGTGIVNNSEIVQSFGLNVTDESGSALFFSGDATAGQLSTFNNAGGNLYFVDNSTADKATFNITKVGVRQGVLSFWDNSTAAQATIFTNGNAFTIFYDDSTAGDAIFSTSDGGAVLFSTSSSADSGIFQCAGGAEPGQGGGGVQFDSSATASESYLVINGAAVARAIAAHAQLVDAARGGNAIFLINGAAVTGAEGATMTLYQDSTAEAASITINGGSNGGGGASLFFFDHSDGGTASIAIFDNGQMDIGNRARPGVTIGSLEGNGLVYLGAKTLTIGSNNQSKVFSGTIQDGGVNHGTGGSLVKIGAGTLTLSGSNSYTGTTTVSSGALQVSNSTGSATGTGAINVNGGTLGGKGIIAGPATIGTGSGPGAFLAPALGSKTQATLTIQSALTLNADATYTYSFKAKKNKSRTDLVKANGVTINGATIDLAGTTQGNLKRGLTLTLISNTSANSINGAFSNLAEGAIVTVNGNNFQASYTGGDGNDLTLTLVP